MPFTPPHDGFPTAQPFSAYILSGQARLQV